jgi:DNA-binding response OmpR family regulator
LKKKILVVDDEADFAEMIKMRLEANDFEVAVAYDGAEGLQKALTEKPSLILLDVMMPGMDGFEVLRRLKRADETMDTPVVMLTAKGESKSMFVGQELGCTDYLIKPCDSKDLMAVVNRLTKRPSVSPGGVRFSSTRHE